jgi:hypothetical protein
MAFGSLEEKDGIDVRSGRDDEYPSESLDK